MTANMRHFTYDAPNLEATERLGRALAEVLPPGTTVALCGTLGAGKTRLVQAIAAACGVPREEVVSPTFVLCHEYHGTRDIYHLDAYRLRDDDEFLELGPEEYFASPGLTLIEWADRVIDCLPRERIEIRIEVTGPEARRFSVTAIGKRFEDLVTALDSAFRAEPAKDERSPKRRALDEQIAAEPQLPAPDIARDAPSSPTEKHLRPSQSDEGTTSPLSNPQQE
jgi:tRNA threonylcarbamoyladenosine biosynthesis protein TsaE